MQVGCEHRAADGLGREPGGASLESHRDTWLVSLQHASRPCQEKQTQRAGGSPVRRVSPAKFLSLPSLGASELAGEVHGVDRGQRLAAAPEDWLVALWHVACDPPCQGEEGRESDRPACGGSHHSPTLGQRRMKLALVLLLACAGAATAARELQTTTTYDLLEENERECGSIGGSHGRPHSSLGQVPPWRRPSECPSSSSDRALPPRTPHPPLQRCTTCSTPPAWTPRAGCTPPWP